MKKIIKGCCIGGALYGMLVFGCTLGKIKMLRSWQVCEQADIKPSDIVSGLKNDRRLKAKFIGYMSELKESQ